MVEYHPSIQKTIFQPGYTTKERGWGLGLSLARRIVEGHHNGKIYIITSKRRRRNYCWNQSANYNLKFYARLIKT